MKTAIFALIAISLAAPALAQTSRPVVLELFTSEACSSCPPAEAVLADLQAHDPNLLALSFHVTYWNGPAWTDHFSLQGATDRQSWYANLQNSQNIFTPEAVVDGAGALVGSNRGGVTSAITAAKQNMAPPLPAKITGAKMITVTIGSTDATGKGQIWLFGYDPKHVTQVGGGENGGATIKEVNVVRSMSSLGTWIGGIESFSVPRPAGLRTAVILQKPDGTIVAAATD
jgi:hypothetical protein